MGSAEESLEDENFTVKVFPSVNEVMASYLVDEHQLELKLKVPGALPLQRIEVKEVKKVGVDDLRWRAWMLSVQQIIWSRVCFPSAAVLAVIICSRSCHW